MVFEVLTVRFFQNAFVMNSCGRAVIVQLMQQCLAIEKVMQEQEDAEE